MPRSARRDRIRALDRSQSLAASRSLAGPHPPVLVPEAYYTYLDHPTWNLRQASAKIHQNCHDRFARHQASLDLESSVGLTGQLESPTWGLCLHRRLSPCCLTVEARPRLWVGRKIVFDVLRAFDDSAPGHRLQILYPRQQQPEAEHESAVRARHTSPAADEYRGRRF